MLVFEKDFQFTQGMPETKHLSSKSGNRYISHYCVECVCPIGGRKEKANGLMIIRPGTLDDTADIVPQAHIWTCEKQAWVQPPTDLPCFEKDYDYKLVWPQTSLDRVKALLKN